MEWISIRDKKPVQVSQPVLVYWYHSQIQPICRVAVWYPKARVYQLQDYGPGWICYFTGIPLSDGITHWMPIPEKPLPEF